MGKVGDPPWTAWSSSSRNSRQACSTAVSLLFIISELLEMLLGFDLSTALV
jgi:hypothetical protein